jgi:hypothetical protein
MRQGKHSGRKSHCPNDSSSSNNNHTNMCDITDEIEMVPTHVPRRKRHPVVNASINNFNDGQDVFIVNGNEYIAKPVGVDNLRRFASKK